MQKADLARAALFARLANIETLDTLTDGERLVLEEQLSQHFNPAPPLSRLWQEVRQLLVGLVDHGKVDAPFDTPTWRILDGCFHKGPTTTAPWKMALVELERLLTTHPTPFLFARCQQCRLIFVRDRKKKLFCSHTCAMRAVESRRQQPRKSHS